MALSKEKKELLKTDFEAGELPVTEIAKKHGVSRATIGRLEKKHGWKRGKRPKQKPSKEKKPSRGGRPEKYNPEWNKQVTALCLLGHTDVQLAEFLNIVISTFYEWKIKHSEFSDALLNGRKKASSQVAVSLFRRANGYSHEAEKIFFDKDAVTDKDRIVRAKTVKHYPPETKAIALILKSKFPEIWSDTVTVAATVVPKIGEIQEEDVKAVQDLFDSLVQ